MKKGAKVAYDGEPYFVVAIDDGKVTIQCESETLTVPRREIERWGLTHEEEHMIQSWVGRHVVLRDDSEGVYWGILVSVNTKTKATVLREARQAHSWEGAAATAGLAAYGPRGGDIGPPVDLLAVDLVSIKLCTPQANEVWAAMSEWSP